MYVSSETNSRVFFLKTEESVRVKVNEKEKGRWEPKTLIRKNLFSFYKVSSNIESGTFTKSLRRQD